MEAAELAAIAGHVHALAKRRAEAEQAAVERAQRKAQA